LNYLRVVILSHHLGAGFLARFTIPIAESLDINARIICFTGSGDNATSDAIGELLGCINYPMTQLVVDVRMRFGGDDPFVNLDGKFCLPIACKMDQSPLLSNYFDDPGIFNIRIYYDKRSGLEPFSFVNTIFKKEAKNLRKLIISGSVGLSEWNHIFKKIPYLKTLTIEKMTGSTLPEIYSALLLLFSNQTPSDDNPQTTSKTEDDKFIHPLLLPALRKLRFTQIDTSKYLQGTAQFQNPDKVQAYLLYMAEFLDQLINYLNMQSKHGCVLKETWFYSLGPRSLSLGYIK
jgi:hypothetical protein